MAHLTLQQRYKIERMLQQGASRRQIAAEIGVDHSTVSREIKKGLTKCHILHLKKEE